MRHKTLRTEIVEDAVFGKIFTMVRRESEGRRKINLNQLCRSISNRFRLRNEEIEKLIREMENGKKWKLGRIKRYNIYFP